MIGEEAVAVGVIAGAGAARRIVATYREHGHALVRGVPMTTAWRKCTESRRAAAADAAARCTCSIASTNFYGGNAIVGGGLPLAVGLALADRMRGEDTRYGLLFRRGRRRRRRVSREPQSRRALELPVLFVCENNLYAMGTALASSESETDIQRKAACYRIASEAVDGMDVVAVEAAARRAVHAVRDERQARSSWNAAPTACGHIPCLMPSFIATRRRSTLGGTRSRSCAFEAGSRLLT